jgi:ERCC4-related helicase
LRAYQERAVEKGKNQSLIVVLPTGSGKTLIASKIASHHIEAGKKILFLVPTCLLVQQQAQAVRSEIGTSVVEYMGGAAVPSAFKVLVSTPAAFISLNASNSNFCYESFGLIIFDEVHHVVKKHPYRKIARSLACISPVPLILGLTASLTYAMGSSRIQTAIVELCTELNLPGASIFSASQDELIADGYHASAVATITLASDLDLGKIANGLEIQGKPHEGMKDFMTLYTSRSLHPLTLDLIDSVYKVESLVQTFDNQFSSPIGASGKHGKSANWGFYANSRSKHFTGDNCKLYYVLEHLYEAMRLLINSRQSALELALCYLELTDLYKHPVLSLLATNWASSRDQLLRVAHLKEVLLVQHDKFTEGLRCIVFVQQRITTHILHHAIMTDPDLSSILTSDYIYATSSPATYSLGVSAAKSQKTIEKFRQGAIQVLFSTSVAEEGMDVPAANCVIRFDPITTPVSLVQSRGRARQADSSFVVLSEVEGRSVLSLEQAEQAQQEAISAVNTGSVDTAELLKKRLQAQVSRRMAAKPLLVAFRQGINKQPPLATLKAYAQKTAGEVIESVSKKRSGFSSHLFLSLYFFSSKFMFSFFPPAFLRIFYLFKIYAVRCRRNIS